MADESALIVALLSTMTSQFRLVQDPKIIEMVMDQYILMARIQSFPQFKHLDIKGLKQL